MRVFDPKIQDRAEHLLQFDLEQLVAALNDDAYLLKLMDQLNKQLKYREDWSEEAKVDRPFWWNHNDITTTSREKSSKLEVEDEEQDPSVLISMKLAQMPSNHSKMAFLGTLLYPKIKELYPNQTNKLYNICLDYDIDEIQQAICSKDGLDALLTQAQIQLETQINQLKATIIAKQNKRKKKKDDKEKEKKKIDGKQKGKSVDNGNGHEQDNNGLNNEPSNVDDGNVSNLDNLTDEDDSDDESNFSDFEMDINIKPRTSKSSSQVFNPEDPRMKEIVFKLMDSWNDPVYSHLRTFRKFDPIFSKRDRLYDHSTRQMVFNNDELFVIKDVVVHTG